MFKCFHSLVLGDELGEKPAMGSRSSSMVDANTSLLCQLHSHQEKHRLENQQFDTQYQLEHLRSDNDKTKLFDEQYSKNKNLSLMEIQVSKLFLILLTKNLLL